MPAVLDACVLFPTMLRQVLIACAEAELITPLWSDRILEEWRRAVLRHHPDQGDIVAAEIALVQARFPQACLVAAPDIEARLDLPDSNDRHVLATAIAGRADTIITLNLRDFPARTLSRDGISPRHPDVVVTALYHDNPRRISALVAPILAQATAATGLEPRKLLKKSGLARLGKAMG